MDNQDKNICNIPTIINSNGKEYKFKQLTIYQQIEVNNYCSELVKTEIENDGKKIGLNKNEIMELFRDTTTDYAIIDKHNSLEAGIFRIKLALKFYHSNEEIEEFINNLTEDILEQISEENSKREEEEKEDSKKKGQIAKRKKKISQSG